MPLPAQPRGRLVDGGSLLWGTSFELGMVVMRAVAHSNLYVGLGACAVLLTSWLLPLQPGFALGLVAIAFLHHGGYDAASSASATELSAIREHAVLATGLILLATLFWLIDLLSHQWRLFGHALWHMICAVGVGHLVAAACFSHVAGGGL